MLEEANSVEKEELPTEAQQAAKTELRESFLMAINKLYGQSCKIETFEKTMLQGTFAAWNPESQDVLVKDLNTPANISIKSALLRSSDILSMQFNQDAARNLIMNT